MVSTILGSTTTMGVALITGEALTGVGTIHGVMVIMRVGMIHGLILGIMAMLVGMVDLGMVGEAIIPGIGEVLL